MHKLSLFWAMFITIITIIPAIMMYNLLKTTRKKALLLVMVISIYIYSGIGIAYAGVDKNNIIYYFIFLSVFCISYTFLVEFDKKIRIGSVVIGKSRCIDDVEFWKSKFAYKTFVALMYLYIVIRLISLLYPVNHLANFSFTYNSINNISNLTGANTTFLDTIANMLMPFFYIGLMLICKKVRQVFVFLTFDVVITWLKTGYLTRHILVTVVIICLLLYFNGDLNNKYISLTKRWRRIITAVLIIVPIMMWVMLTLMEKRLTNGTDFTISEFFYTELSYPTQYAKIHNMSPLVQIRDFFLQLLDSFVPVIPTPKYHMDLNVDFSISYGGYGIDVAWFSVLLPSILGEAFLIFGNYFYWIHAIIIALLIALIYKLVRENHCLTILWYYYLVCALKTGRAGYEQLSQSILLNFIIVYMMIHLLRYIWNKSVREKANE